MTGNTEKFPGRRSKLSLRNQSVTLFYEALPESFLHNKILAPRLEQLLSNKQLVGQSAQSILMLWKQYQSLLPDHEFTPRDLHEICDRLGLWLKNKQADVSKQAINELIWKAFEETLGGEIEGNRSRLRSLYIWYLTKTGMQPELLKQGSSQGLSSEAYQLSEAPFDAFYRALPSSPEFTFQGASTRELARQYWQVMTKADTEIRMKTVSPGKHALLVEGPPGRGKDELFRHLHAQLATRLTIDKQPVCITAGLNNWEETRNAIKKAAETGSIIVISELNRIPSQYLEEDLNNLLTGDIKPGFLLIGTVNPSEFAGRETFSQALYSRFVRHSIGDYSDTELHTIAMNTLPGNLDLARKIVTYHCRLRSLSLKNSHTAITPSTSDLVSLLKHVSAHTPQTEEQLEDLFTRQYRPLMTMADVTWETLVDDDSCPPDSLQATTVSTAPGMQDGEVDLLSRLYTCFPDSAPLHICYGQPESFDRKSGQLRINVETNNPLALGRAIQLMINEVWLASGMPDSFPLKSDVLACGLMGIWKLEFVTSRINDLPLSEEQKQTVLESYQLSSVQKKTLALPENSKLVDEAKAFLAGSAIAPSLPDYLQFLKILASPVIAEGEVSDTDVMDTTSDTEATDNSTENIPLPKGAQGAKSISEDMNTPRGDGGVINVTPIFENRRYADQRLIVMIPDMNQNGKLVYRINPLGEVGYNGVEYQSFSSSTVLSQSQERGMQTLPLSDGRWHPLCGFMNPPQTSLVYLTVTPDCEVQVVQDRRTGLYLIRKSPTDQSRESVGYKVAMGLEPESSNFTIGMEKFTTENKHSQCPDWVKRGMEKVKKALLEGSMDTSDSLRNVVFRNGNQNFEGVKNCLETFDTSSDLSQFDGEELVFQLFKQRPNSSAQKRLACWIMATWLGIPARIAEGPGKISENGGYTWIPVPISGHVENPASYEEKKQEFPPLKKDKLYISRYGRPSAQKVALWLAIRPGAKDYGGVVENFDYVVANHISLDGPVNPDLVIRWLDEYHAVEQNVEVKRLLLSAFLENVREKARKENFEEMWTVLRTLDRSVTTKSWLPPNYKPNLIHQVLSQQRHLVDLVMGREKTNYYEEILTKELTPEKHFQFKAAPDVKRLSSELRESLTQVFEGNESESLTRHLMGERPGISFRQVPPGKIDAERLIQRQPAFQVSKAKLVQRPAMLVVPSLNNSYQLDKLIGEKLQAAVTQPFPEGSYPSMSFTLKSEVMGSFLVPYIKYTFIQYLFRKCGGESGSMKLLIPSAQRARGEGERGYEHLYLTDTTYKPLESGWVKPKSFDDFLMYVSNPEYLSTPCDQDLLKQAWIAKGLNQSNLCLLYDGLINKGLEDWLDEIDWAAVVRLVKQQEIWKDHLVEKDRECKSIAAEKYFIQKAQEYIEALDYSEHAPSQYYVMAAEGRGGIINDI